MIKSASEKAPHYLVNYLFNLAQTFNGFYNSVQIINSEEEVKNFRLLLVKATQLIIGRGLDILNIKTVEKM